MGSAADERQDEVSIVLDPRDLYLFCSVSQISEKSFKVAKWKDALNQIMEPDGDEGRGSAYGSGGMKTFPFF